MNGELGLGVCFGLAVQGSRLEGLGSPGTRMEYTLDFLPSLPTSRELWSMLRVNDSARGWLGMGTLAMNS